MKFDPERVLLVADAGPQSRGWSIALPFTLAAIAIVLAIYWSTAKSIVAVWGSSDTYAHGYLIVPIALVLVWLKRRDVASVSPSPDILGYILLATAGVAWLAGEAAQVQVLQHYALAAMLPATVLALAGRKVARRLAFPLGFLLLAVPFGEAFLPRLMEWTADFTVGALRLSGIPVYREGNFFAIPSGHWSVVEACSGLRYLIASVTVGALYAYLTYRKWWKRAIFMALSIAVPIFANFLRAYLIVMIGHLSSMKLAVGVDHFIYGWVFFGAVIALLFWLGSFWRDAPAVFQQKHFQTAPARPAFILCAALGVAALAAAGPLYARYLNGPVENVPPLAAPAATAGWSLETQPATPWRPHYAAPAAEVLALYRKDEATVAVYLGHYRNQRQGAELVSSQNRVAGGSGSPWVSVGQGAYAEGSLELRETRLRSAHGRLLVWDWYRVAGRDLRNPYVAKALLARDKLLGRGDDSTAIALAAPYDARPEAAAQTLRLFLRDMRPALDSVLASMQQK